MSTLFIPRLNGALVDRGADSFASLAAIFCDAPQLALQQAWLSQPESDFTPATVRVGWGSTSPKSPHQGSALWVWADLIDEAPYNAATESNQCTWELGDVFEIFIGASQEWPYFEMHVTPENQTLQLHFATPESPFVECLMPNGPLWSATRFTPRGWQVLAALPLADILRESETGFVSFSRYDYQAGRAEPVISSTSTHAEPNFHRRFEWTPFRLEA